MKYITALGLGLMALIGWMKKYTGIAFLMLVFVFCSTYYKTDIITLMRESAQREEAKEIRKEQAEKEERERLRLEAIEKRREAAEQKKVNDERLAQEAKLKQDIATAQQERERRASVEAARALARQKVEEKELLQLWEAAGYGQDDIYKLCPQATRVECMKLMREKVDVKVDKAVAKIKADHLASLEAAKCQPTQPINRSISGFSGHFRYTYTVNVADGMVRGVTLDSKESFPEMRPNSLQDFKNDLVYYVGKFNCTGTGNVTFKVDARYQ